MPPIPGDNPQTPDKVRLGKMLFFDRRLSLAGETSCVYCHSIEYWGAEPVGRSLGVEGKTHLRHSPTVLNSGFLKGQFWDGRDPDLETQALSAIKSKVAMNQDPDEVAKRLNAIPGYRELFLQVFGTEATPEAIGQAIAAFERTLNTPDYPLARFLKGDVNALTLEQQEGLKLFVDKGCIACHGGPNFTRELRVPVRLPGAEDDQGLFRTTQREEDKYVFRVPSLLNVAMTPPYMHNGSIKTLEEAVRFMAREMAQTNVTDEEVAKIVAFLHSLTGKLPQVALPELPPGPFEP